MTSGSQSDSGATLMAMRIESGAEPIPGYKLIDRLGVGGFGEVWKAEAPGGLLKAIKIIHGDIGSIDDDGRQRAEQELRALQRIQAIRHPYLLSIERYDVIDGRLIIVTELADCNLMEKFRQFRDKGLPGIPREDLLRYVFEAAEVLDLMNNQHQLQHLDIKPQNLFLIHDHVKVADFGLVKDLEGIRSNVSGGVTPVYASPETFEGLMSRYSDQYSLAIVYQELLTGQRPFGGSSIQQLVMQHLQGSPNLASLPHTDRPVIAKALSKKPEDRHPTCLTMVKLLLAGGDSALSSHRLGPAAGGSIGTATTRSPAMLTENIPRPVGRHAAPSTVRFDTPPTMMKMRREDLSPSPIIEAPPARVAPPEFTGNGSLVPAVIIGLGGDGLAVLKQLKQYVIERLGEFDALPQLKLLYIDTDPETVQIAERGQGALAADEILLCRLNRASHYLKPRRNGRSLIEGWFDPQLLYRIPRNPQTQGVRALGRLAFGDHYRPVTQKLEVLLEEVTRPDALLQADQQTGLGVRSNRPRVYVVANLSGGTGGGMFIDIGYAARGRLKHLGYTPNEVIGLFLLPEAERASGGPKALLTGNTYAALTELNHYGTPGSTYTASFDDREGSVQDGGPPFNRFHALPADSVDPVTDFLIRDLLSPMGRALDGMRAQAISRARTVDTICTSTFGLAVFTWPRQALLDRASRRLCRGVLDRWVSRGAAIELKSAVQAWVVQQWTEQELAPEHLIARLQQACERALGQAPEPLFAQWAEPFVPRGWRAGGINTMAGYDLLGRLEEIIGRPDDSSSQQAGLLGDALLSTADGLVKDWSSRLSQLAVCLIEQPDFRLAGSEEAIHQLSDTLNRALNHYTPYAEELGEKAWKAHVRIHELLQGAGNRRTAAAEFAENLKVYPKWRYQSLLLKQVTTICTTLRSDLADALAEVSFCRQRLEELLRHFERDSEQIVLSPTGYLLPPECRTLDDAVRHLLDGVTVDDVRELDRRIQRMVQSQFTALVNICLSSSNLLAQLEPAMLKIARQYLSNRVGEGNVVELFLKRFSGRDGVSKAVDAADPGLVAKVPLNVPEFVAVALPPEAIGGPVERQARAALDGAELVVTPSTDDIIIYRELPRLPLAKLPQMGPIGRDAYQQLTNLEHFTPHTRTDVDEWIGPA